MPQLLNRVVVELSRVLVLFVCAVVEVTVVVVEESVLLVSKLHIFRIRREFEIKISMDKTRRQGMTAVAPRKKPYLWCSVLMSL